MFVYSIYSKKFIVFLGSRFLLVFLIYIIETISMEVPHIIYVWMLLYFIKKNSGAYFTDL